MTQLVETQMITFVQCPNCKTLQSARISNIGFTSTTLHEVLCKECGAKMGVQMDWENEVNPTLGLV